MTACSWIIVLWSDHWKRLPVSLSIWVLFGLRGHNAFCDVTVLAACAHTHTHVCGTAVQTHSHMQWIIQTKIKAFKTPQADSETGFWVHREIRLLVTAFQYIGSKANSSVIKKTSH